MRSLLIKITLLLGMLFAIQSADASLFGWRTTVIFNNGTSNVPVSVSGPTFWDCEIARQQAVSLYTSHPLNYSVVSNPPCAPLIIKILRIPNIKWDEIKWPPGPVCLSCPYLREDLINQIYPAHKARVSELIQQYDIKSYQEELKQLNERYDLKGFEREMFDVQMEQQIMRGK